MAEPEMTIERNRKHVRDHRTRLEEAGLRQNAIWLPAGLHDRVTELVKSKRYRNRSEAIAALLEEKLEETEQVQS